MNSLKRIGFHQGTFVFDQNEVRYELPGQGVYINSLKELSHLENSTSYAFPFESDFTVDKQNFIMYFQVPDDYIPFETLRQVKWMDSMKIARNLIRLGRFFAHEENLITILDPLNVLVHPQEGDVKVLYRGLQGLMPGNQPSENLNSIKNLLMLLFSSATMMEIKRQNVQMVLQKTSDEHVHLVRQIDLAKDFTDLLRTVTRQQKQMNSQKEKLQNEDPIQKSWRTKWDHFISRFYKAKNNNK